MSDQLSNQIACNNALIADLIATIKLRSNVPGVQNPDTGVQNPDAVTAEPVAVTDIVNSSITDIVNGSIVEPAVVELVACSIAEPATNVSVTCSIDEPTEVIIKSIVNFETVNSSINEPTVINDPLNISNDTHMLKNVSNHQTSNPTHLTNVCGTITAANSRRSVCNGRRKCNAMD